MASRIGDVLHIRAEELVGGLAVASPEIDVSIPRFLFKGNQAVVQSLLSLFQLGPCSAGLQSKLQGLEHPTTNASAAQRHGGGERRVGAPAERRLESDGL